MVIIYNLATTLETRTIKVEAIMSSQLDLIRRRAADVISNFSDLKVHDLRSTIQEFINAGGPKDDFLVAIGEQMLGMVIENGSNDRKMQGPEGDRECVIPGSTRVDFDNLRKFMEDCFQAVGVPRKESIVCADVLITADIRGIDSHGVGRLKPIYFDRIASGILKPYQPITIVRETATTALLDGNMGLGLYVGPYCMDLAIQKSKQSGIGFVVAKNSTHYGIAGYYASMATKAGCVGFTGTNARPSIAPTHGVEPCLGTNPLCFGVPTDEEFPFVIDCATSITQRGAIEKYARLGLPTPRGLVVDERGEQRTDTEEILRDMVSGSCALCPLGGLGEAYGGYKGYGWATLVELMCTSFSDGPFGPDLCGVDRDTGKPAPMPLGHFFLAIDIQAVCGDLTGFQSNAGNLLRFLRDSKKDPNGPGRIWTAGEPEWEASKYRTAADGVLLPPALQKDMQNLRDTLPGLAAKWPRFTFE